MWCSERSSTRITSRVQDLRIACVSVCIESNIGIPAGTTATTVVSLFRGSIQNRMVFVGLTQSMGRFRHT
jgi:hypothetical protein